MMADAALAALLLLASQTVAPAPLDPDDTIVVTGVKLTDLAAAVERCAAGGCSPRRDIVASIRYAEALFRGGDVRHARDVLARAVSRTKGAGAAEPIALSQLCLARANVAGHWGDQREYATAIYASARVVRDNLPANSPDVLSGALLVADLQVREGKLIQADAAYRSVAARARASGQATLAASADLRRAWLLDLRGEQTGSRDLKAQSRELIARIADDPAAARSIRTTARVIAARIARKYGDTGATDALLKTLGGSPDAAPVLLWEPPLKPPTSAVTLANAFEIQQDTQTKSSDRAPLLWADVGFWITPGGTVADAEVLRGSRDTSWTAPILATVAARRYTPFADAPSAQGRYRIERFTLTADFVTPIGSNIRRRAGMPHYERIDLTEAPATPPPGL